MQLVAVGDPLVGVEMKPALPAVLLGTRVPGNRQRLQPAVRELNEILLQRMDSKGVLNLVIMEFAVRPVGVDEKFSVALEEGGSESGVGELCVAKITEHALFRSPAPSRRGAEMFATPSFPHGGRRHRHCCRRIEQLPQQYSFPLPLGEG